MTGLPDLLTVEEAARVLRIGRTKAYAMATEWRRTAGKSGLPVVDIGGLRVPTCQLEAMIGAPITSLGPLAITTAVAPPTDATPPATEPEPGPAQAVSTDPAPQQRTSPARSEPRPSRRRTRTTNQPTLPFPG